MARPRPVTLEVVDASEVSGHPEVLGVVGGVPTDSAVEKRLAKVEKELAELKKALSE